MAAGSESMCQRMVRTELPTATIAVLAAVIHVREHIDKPSAYLPCRSRESFRGWSVLICARVLPGQTRWPRTLEWRNCS